jgi:putative lipoic acid-binding regulatory protein
MSSAEEGDVFAGLQAKLDETQTWPCRFMFKFVTPKDRVGEVLELFPAEPNVSTRDSRNGNYVGVTAEVLAFSSEEIIEVYRAAAEIPGVISL